MRGTQSGAAAAPADHRVPDQLRVACAAMAGLWNRLRGCIVAAQAAAADPDRKPSRFERLMNLLMEAT
jgi:hypothetical protein